MKAYLATVLVIDFENQGPDDLRISMENLRYWTPSVMDIKTADIGEWSDDHPLNKYDTMESECKRLFEPKTEG